MVGVHEIDGDTEVPEVVVVGQGEIHLFVGCTYVLVGEERCIGLVRIVTEIVHSGDGCSCIGFVKVMVVVEEIEHLVKSGLHFLFGHSARVVAEACCCAGESVSE